MAESSGNSGWGAVAGAAITTAGNYAITAASNRRQYKFQTQAMDKQLLQNKQLWDYQNAYNTPAAQMGRLRAAGLNPNLIYGQGAGGMNAGPIQGADVPVRQVAKPEVGNSMLAYLSARQMDAQYEATRATTEAMRTRTLWTEIQSALSSTKLIMETARSKKASSLASSEDLMKRFIAQRSKQLLYNEQSKGNLLDQLYEVRKSNLTGLNLDNEFKVNRNDLAKLGLYSSDNPLVRVLVTAAKRMGVDLAGLLNDYGSYVKELISK